MLTPKDGPDGRIAFFGHSMGGLIAFEVARRFESAGNPITALFVSASAAPGHINHEFFRKRSDDGLVTRSDDELVKMVSDVTGTSPEFLDEQFVATILPTLRSYRAIVDYDCPAGTTLSCPIYAFAGADDDVVDYDSVLAWSDLTSSDFSVRVFPGGHFYVTENVRELAEEVETKISLCAG
jgi:surfactin synthase thioesterase subunit